MPRWPPGGRRWIVSGHDPEEYQHDATTLAGLVAGKEVTAAELLALARARRDQVNPTLNAIVRRSTASPTRAPPTRR